MATLPDKTRHKVAGPPFLVIQGVGFSVLRQGFKSLGGYSLAFPASPPFGGGRAAITRQGASNPEVSIFWIRRTVTQEIVSVARRSSNE